MCDSCKQMVLEVPAKDWVVKEIQATNGGFRLIGENLNWPVGHMDRGFRWIVRDLNDPRYDFSGAVFTLEGK